MAADDRIHDPGDFLFRPVFSHAERYQVITAGQRTEDSGIEKGLLKLLCRKP